ncbi:MAG: undecaprenyldiphospho-muramoylpentapeptide beta-N-acetylglucosaminyltransferase [Deltaproteobacteria bacterium]|nr:MAG: undecaprenyldiphospho-muramoylpentapeptide beta-N-acetylglucosaminyltransferase [Deltaproteobacteria bacterium]
MTITASHLARPGTAPRGGVVIAGGGTGGHLYPGLALADALAEQGFEVTFVGTASGIEARIVPAAGYPLRLLPGRQLRGGGAGRAVAGLATVARGAVRGRGLLGELRPRLVVGVGGYASVAVVLAARLSRIPIVLLEQNVVPGAANRLLGRLAARVCVGFADSVRFFPRGRAVHTGNPIRREILRGATRTPRARPGLLVFGGSGGAHQLNVATIEALRTLGAAARDLEVTHQTGSADVEEVRAAHAALGLATRVEPFITDMAAAYAAADLVISRAGAMSCAEITAVGLPAILVPYPYAADDHQRLNAEVLVAAGAAQMILDRDCSGERLGAAIRDLVNDPARRAAMAARARAVGRPDAAEQVAAECLRFMS